MMCETSTSHTTSHWPPTCMHAHHTHLPTCTHMRAHLPTTHAHMSSLMPTQMFSLTHHPHVFPHTLPTQLPTPPRSFMSAHELLRAGEWISLMHNEGAYNYKNIYM